MQMTEAQEYKKEDLRDQDGDQVPGIAGDNQLTDMPAITTDRQPAADIVGLATGATVQT